jgi:hypothetical protein
MKGLGLSCSRIRFQPKAIVRSLLIHIQEIVSCH